MPKASRGASALSYIIPISRIGNAFAFTFLTPGKVYNEKTVVFPFVRTAQFAVLHSRGHEVWSRFFSSTLKDDLQYTPSDCFETFPFPDGWESRPALEAAGQIYYEFRAALMVRNDEGLTKTYNRFHDPYEDNPEIGRLRELHAAMDRAVLDAYGWTDIPTDCDFLLDYEIDEATWGRKKKPYRYRWPDSVRTRSSPASSPSTPNAPPRKPAWARRPPRLPGHRLRSPDSNVSAKHKHFDPPSWPQSPNPSGPPTMIERLTLPSTGPGRPQQERPEIAGYNTRLGRLMERSMIRDNILIKLMKPNVNRVLNLSTGPAVSGTGR